MKTRITELLGIEHPIFQAAMSWASSNAPLVIAVSNAGGMGVLGAGPLRPDDFSRILDEIRDGTKKPFGVNIPLNGARAPELLEIALRKKIPVMIASQGGPRELLPRFRAIGAKWLHVVASVEHASKAEAAGVDALVVDGAEAGGHPPPSNVGTIVLVRRIVRATRLPVVASGGVADGAGVAALLALGAEAVQLGTRFIATPEATAAGVPQGLEIRMGNDESHGGGRPSRLDLTSQWQDGQSPNGGSWNDIWRYTSKATLTYFKPDLLVGLRTMQS